MHAKGLWKSTGYRCKETVVIVVAAKNLKPSEQWKVFFMNPCHQLSGPWNVSLEDRLLKLDKVGAETCKVATWLSQIPFGWSDAGFFRTVTCCVIKLTGYIMVFQGGCFLEHWVYTKSIMGVVVKSPQPRISTEQCSVLSLCPQLGWVMGVGVGSKSGKQQQGELHVQITLRTFNSGTDRASSQPN